MILEELRQVKAWCYVTKFFYLFLFLSSRRFYRLNTHTHTRVVKLMLFFIRQKVLASQIPCCIQGWTGAQRCTSCELFTLGTKPSPVSHQSPREAPWVPKCRTERSHQGFRTHRSLGAFWAAFNLDLTDRTLISKTKRSQYDGQKRMGAKFWRVGKTM